MPVSTLAQWRTLHGLSADGNQDYGNPSKDGVANLVKYAFNTAPNAGDLSRVNVSTLTAAGIAGLPLIQRNGAGQLVFTCLRRKAATVPDVVYMPEVSANLTAWTSATLSGGSTTSINATWERVTGAARHGLRHRRPILRVRLRLQVRFDLLGEVVHHHHHAVHRRQRGQDPIQDRPALHGQEWFGEFLGVRPQAGALAATEDERLDVIHGGETPRAR